MQILVMAALRSRCGHYIFAMWFLLCIFFLAYSQLPQILATILPRMDGVINSNISSTCPHNMVNCGPLAAEIGSVVWGTPANFNRFRVLASLLQQRH